MKLHYLLFFKIIFFFSLSSHASDLDKEQRWADQISDSLLVGDPVQLKAGSHEFLGIFAEAVNGDNTYAAILLHGMGAHPDWPDVIHPLRSELPELGWSTLSVQMPVLANDAPFEDYIPLFDQVAPRIDAAVQDLTNRGAQTIVLIGHSLGASMGAQYLASHPQSAIKGFIAIGLSVNELDDKANSALALEKIRIPVLDLYGSRDLDGVLDSAPQRRRAAGKAGNDQYRSQEVEGADHFFVGLEQPLVRIVYGWLKAGFQTSSQSPPVSRPLRVADIQEIS